MLNTNNLIIAISDFSPERTFISLNNNLNNTLLEKAIRKAGSQGLLTKLLKSKAVTFKKLWKVYRYEYLWIAKNDNRTNYRGKTKLS